MRGRASTTRRGIIVGACSHEFLSISGYRAIRIGPEEVELTTKPLFVRLPQSLHRRLRIYAARHGVPMSKLVTRAVEDLLRAAHKPGKAS